MSVVIKVEGVSKLYKLGEISTGTFRHDLNRWIKRVINKEDAYTKIGLLNDRNFNDEYVWALKDIDVEIKKGDILGVIGSNGSGKSTLLKLLSKITKPTHGKIYLNGKISSLLEVGTGFHPEMTGRENVFMNGSILGMKKKEIAEQLDSIIDFSGVEKFIDTPIKRYSSGMKVRLGFAVAAHLNQDILIVDEVLAVGDAEFQKKCLGSMQNVSKQGRTVLFVSHNMAAIKQLCTRTLVLNKGSLVADTTTEDGILRYLESARSNDFNGMNLLNEKFEKDVLVSFEQISIKQQGHLVADISNDEDFNVEVLYTIHQRIIGFRLILLVYDNYENLITRSYFDELNDMGSTVSEGRYHTVFSMPANLLIDGVYKLKIISYIHNIRLCKPYEGITLSLNVIETGLLKRKVLPQSDRGLVTLPIVVSNNARI